MEEGMQCLRKKFRNEVAQLRILFSKYKLAEQA